MSKKPTTKTKAKPKSKRPTGRPRAVIDWDRVGRMLEAGATAEGIAATIGIQRDSLYKRCEVDNKCTFSTFSQEKRAKGDELLRTKQFQIAMSGDKTMLIWLGKQRLNQTEKQQTEHTGRDGGPIETNTTVDLSKLTRDELKKLKEIQDKLNG